MPEISVLIPAFRPDFLDLSIASVLAQRYKDFELIISDDSSGSEIESVVSRWSDPRVRMVKNPRRQQPGTNRDHLISLAKGRFLKFLFDDDFLLPHSLEILHEAAVNLGAQMVFHGRHLVDESGRLLQTGSAVTAGQAMILDRVLLFREMVPRAFNFVGEPSNILLEAEALRAMDNPFGIDQHRMRFLTDVALYLNLADAGRRIVGVGAALSAFRRHGAQTSAVGGTNFSAGIFEWELAARWGADRGHLDAHDCATAIQNVRTLYATHVAAYPELAAFLELPPVADPAGRFLTDRFMAAVEAGWTAIDVRRNLPAAA